MTNSLIAFVLEILIFSLLYMHGIRIFQNLCFKYIKEFLASNIKELLHTLKDISFLI